MRKTMNEQMKMGEVAIEDIQLDLKSRDEIPKLLMGLQFIYKNHELRQQTFKILERIIPDGVDRMNGRPGKPLWDILVLGTIRINCNWNYDKIQEIANNHRTIRLFLGVGALDDDCYFPLQTIKDNVALLTPEVLDEINELVVKYGQQVIAKENQPVLNGKCDSFVVETNVHYPTDINLLCDAMRKIIVLISRLCVWHNISGWRQSKNNVRAIKSKMLEIQNLRRVTKKNSATSEKKLRKAYSEYLNTSESLIEKTKGHVEQLKTLNMTKTMLKKLGLLEEYLVYAVHQLDLIDRRLLRGETIPHADKIFSIFETHTEWICKGKAGVPQELGLKVCILRDQYGFILKHEVMQHLSDAEVAVPFLKKTKNTFPNLTGCSLDKGFYSKENKEKLKEFISQVVMPKKGKPNEQEKLEESSIEFKKGRKKHSVVESSISALENHGLDVCPDKGLAGFNRYVSLAVLARNIQILGHFLQVRENKKQMRKTIREARMQKAA